MAFTIDDLSFMSSQLGTTDPNDLSSGMTEEQKKKVMGFIDKKEPTLFSQKTETKPIGDILNKYSEDVGAANERYKKDSGLLIPKQATTKTTKKTRDVADVKPVRDEYVTKLEPKEQKMVRNTVAETQSEIKQAAEDPSIFAQAAEQLGVAGDYAASLFENFDNPLDRVDWLTMATIYAASRSQGNNATMAIANGLLRGMESKGKQEQAKAILEANAAQAQQGQANKDRQFMLDKYNAESTRMQAEAATQRASGAGKELLSTLDADERKVADAAAEASSSDSALAYEAANQLKKQGQPVTALGVKRAIEQIVKQGYGEDPFIGKKTLL